jgi:hypothetical protein
MPILTFHKTNTTWTFGDTWIFTNISIISLHPLILSKTQFQSGAKNFDINPVTRRERSTEPAKVTSMNIQPQLRAQITTLELE